MLYHSDQHSCWYFHQEAEGDDFENEAEGDNEGEAEDSEDDDETGNEDDVYDVVNEAEGAEDHVYSVVNDLNQKLINNVNEAKNDLGTLIEAAPNLNGQPESVLLHNAGKGNIKNQPFDTIRLLKTTRITY